MSKKLNREELAAIEVGHTTVSRGLARGIVICFLLCICSVPLVQTLINSENPAQPSLLESIKSLLPNKVAQKNTQTSFITAVKQRNNQLLEAMDSFEKQLEEESFLRSYLLAPGQRIFLGLGYGNEKVYPGKNNWLFYRPDMDYLMGPGFLENDQLAMRRDGGAIWETAVQPDPIPAIRDFQAQLADRGIQLILMPTPVKASIHPELFSSGDYKPPLQNKSWEKFLNEMQSAGILLFDPAPILYDFYKNENENKSIPTYLETDTHWRPDAMEEVAKELAAFVENNVSLSKGTEQFHHQQQTISNRGDIEVMLRIPDQWKLYTEESVTIHPILNASDELWQNSTDAEIVLLGDSFSNIFSLAGMGWGEGAGLGEQLSFMLQRPVDMLLQNDSGAFATREKLAQELARGRDRLSGKKVLVWQFATRELSSGDWKAVPMVLQEQTESEFYTPAIDEEIEVIATVVALSRSPVPGSVPYKDNILTLHLDDIRSLETDEELGQSLVYGWGMRDNILEPLAKVRIGEQIQIRLIDWDMVQGKYSSYRRSTLDDEMIELELPVWGEIVQP